MPKIEKDLLKVKGSDGQWHYVPAVGGSVDTAPTWDAVQNKPFSTLGDGLSVDEDGVLSAQGGGGSANAVQYVAQSLTDEQKKQARTNIGASPIPTVRYWLDLRADNIINLYNMGVGYGIISPVDYDQTVPTGMSSPMLVIFGRMNYGRVDITVYDGAGAVWSGSLNLSSQTTDVTKTGDYVTNTALTDILHNYVPAENYKENLQVIVQAIDTKLDKNQGAGNAGKILGIGADGIVVPQDKPTYTLPQATADALGGSEDWTLLAEQTTTEIVREISLTLPKSVKHVVAKIWCPATGAEAVNRYTSVKIGASYLFYYIAPNIPDKTMTSQLTVTADSIDGGYWRLSYYANRGGDTFDKFTGYNQNESVVVGVTKAAYTEANTFAIMTVATDTTQQFPAGTILKVWGF